MVYTPNKAIHPGHVISRSLDREGMSQKSLSERTGLSEKHISQIINGEASLTVETSLLLENALGGSASFWINLEKDYQETKARVERQALLKEEVSIVSSYPYNDLAKRGFVEPTTNKEKRVENLWKFFGVNSLLFVKDTEAVAFRKKDGLKIKSEHIATWLRCGEIEMKKLELPEFSETKLKQSLDKIKKLSLKTAEDFSVEVKSILAESGVALVYVPHFTGTKVSGAVRWINNIPVIQISLFGAYADIFWFTLFHEIGHLVLHGKKEQFIEFDDPKLSAVQEKEKEADKFSSDTLIPPEKFGEFIKIGVISKETIVKYSNYLGINPGILAGRLCHENLTNWSVVSSLRPRLKFAD